MFISNKNEDPEIQSPVIQKKNSKKNEQIFSPITDDKNKYINHQSLPIHYKLVKPESPEPKRNIKFFEIIEQDEKNSPSSPNKLSSNNFSIEQSKKLQEEPKIKTIAGSLMRDIRTTLLNGIRCHIYR